MSGPDDLLRRALASDDPAVLGTALRLATHPLGRFRPRPDRPELLDEQASFYRDQFDGLACVLGGNGSGKSFVGAAKVARFLAETPPPEPLTPFWVLSTTMDLATSNCWSQNLSRFIPPKKVASSVWYSQSRQLPKTVVLQPHKSGHAWVLEFKSYDQGRERLQGANIGGFWADEQCPSGLLAELWARTRRWSLPGSKLYTLTPLEPDPDLERIYHEREQWPSWRFYRFSTRENPTLDPSFVRQLTENEIEGLIETRLTGAFARYEGAVYPSFDTKLHVVRPFEIPTSWLHVRGLDLGWSHGTACVWAARDLEGRYWVYREYLKTKTSVEDHVAEINDDWAGKANRGLTYADPAAAQTLHEFAVRGLPTRPANKDVKAGIATVQGLLRPDESGRPKLLVFDSCQNLIRELRTYTWDAKKMDQPRKVDDDLVDALRYMAHSHRQEAQVALKPPQVPEKQRPGQLFLAGGRRP